VVEPTKGVLRNLLLSSYEDLANWLTRRLGSQELAREALQETYLRLERGNEIGPVHSPKAYLLRTAINIAIITPLLDPENHPIPPNYTQTDFLLSLSFRLRR